ncbi:MAG: fused MFS/spermidine synthase [Phycisphaerales bacterium]|nr:fused MFS/spermidine synthase [Planctomycetota bacterium]MCH8509641.1 fused MFS/spermidine synthase [Phycisphaerales bacterium]
MVIVFTIAVFLAAALLFGVQPMVAKSLLPDFGGGSSVWTTCMLFYQTMLIAGYLYAHLLLTRVPRQRQFIIHGVVIVVALVVGWLYDDPKPPQSASEFPVPWLLWQLFLVSGLPYFAISSAGPLLQGWFARTGHHRAHDPYFLYAASNAGSFVGLLAYPFIFEPALGLDQQRALWLGLFALFGVLAYLCLRATRADRHEALRQRAEKAPEDDAITWRRRAWWVFLAFVPSTMLLGVTTHITTDIASFPLLWVIPLSLYLLTMIAAFSGRAPAIIKSMARPMVLSVITALVLLVAWADSDQIAPLWAMFLVQLALLGTVGLYGHSRLAMDRPHAAHLTEFFLLMSVGGAMGGLFNGIIAPLVFNDGFEYHIALVCSLLMLPAIVRTPEKSVLRYWFSRLWIPALSLAAFAAAVLFTRFIDDPVMRLMLWLIPPGVLVYMGWRDRVSATGACLFPLVGVIIATQLDPRVIYKERTFFGIHKVEQRMLEHGMTHWIVHGTTMHGMQYYGNPELAMQPLGYYHYDGPCGAIVKALYEMRPDRARICILGLGSGAMVTHGRPGDEIIFMEIDPAVARIAKDERFFTYLRDAVCDVEVRLGDARLLLERSQAAGEAPFDVVHADAFSSDSIPTHLLTREAIALYFDRVTEDGMVVMHISNRYLDLYPLLYELARLEGCFILRYSDNIPADHPDAQVRFSSEWVVLTKSQETGMRLAEHGFGLYEPAWTMRPWTDQYSNLLSVISGLR